MDIFFSTKLAASCDPSNLKLLSTWACWYLVLKYFPDTDETKDEHDLDQEYEEISGTESSNPNTSKNSVHFILDERGVHF